MLSPARRRLVAKSLSYLQRAYRRLGETVFFFVHLLQATQIIGNVGARDEDNVDRRSINVSLPTILPLNKVLLTLDHSVNVMDTSSLYIR